MYVVRFHYLSEKMQYYGTVDTEGRNIGGEEIRNEIKCKGKSEMYIKNRMVRVMVAILSLVLVFMSIGALWTFEAVEVCAEEAQADENGFIIEDGVLKKYTGTATDIVVPDGVTEIGYSAFSGCSSLISVKLPESVRYISYNAFMGCNKLVNINIPEGVTSIGERAFYGCSSLQSIIISKSVTDIGEMAFSYCGSLTKIVVEEGNKVYDSRGNCNAVIEKSSNMLVFGCNNTIIPDGVISIGEASFYGCSGLRSITIPSSVTNIAQGDIINRCQCAFSGCSDLTSITVEEGNPVYDSRGNCNAIVEKSSNTLILGCKNTVIPNNMWEIGGAAFRGCSSLTSITIPSGVYFIGDNAFSGCSALTSVTMSEGIYLIGNWAFSGCSSLRRITIPNSVRGIYCYAFSGCGSLTSINIPKGLEVMGTNVFYDCSNNLRRITVEEGNPVYDSRENCNAIIEKNSNTLILGCRNTIIPSGVTKIGHSAFYGCSGLISINIPAGVTSIDSMSFYECSSLTNITIPPSVTNIDDSVFIGCSSLAIYGEKDSYVENYAKRHNIFFRLSDSAPDVFSAEEIKQLAEKNAWKDIIIRNGEGLTFTFLQGCMTGDSMIGCDFRATLTRRYTEAKLSESIPKEHFALRIDFRHSGKLPGKASVSIPLGKKYVGKAVIYALLNGDGTYTPQQETTVGQDGILTVEQEHCSSYIVLTKEAMLEILGDVNSDGEIDSKDALAILKDSVGIEQSVFVKEAADINKDTIIDSKDALIVLKHSVGILKIE